MDKTSLFDQTIHDPQSARLEDYNFNYLSIREAVSLAREHDPRFAGASLGDVAHAVGLAESTFKKLLAGNIADPRSSTVWMVCRTLDLNPAIILGLPADGKQVAKCQGDNCSELNELTKLLEESEVQNDELERELEQVRAQLRDESEKLAAIRSALSDKSESLTKASVQAESLERTIAERDASIARRDCMLEERSGVIQSIRKELRFHRRFMAAAILMLIIVVAYFAWEIVNPEIGLTSFFW